MNKQTDIYLNEQLTNYAELVNLARSIILITDVSGNIVFANDFCLKTFGFAREDLIGAPLKHRLLPEFDSKGNSLWLMADELNENPDKFKYYEHENITKSGQRLFISWSNKALKDDKGNVNGILSVGIDITEKMEFQKALEKSEERLKLALQATSEGIWDVNIKTQEYFFNSQFYERYGLDVSDSNQSAVEVFKLLNEEDKKVVSEQYQNILANKSDKFDILFRLNDLDGNTCWLQSKGQVVERDKAGNPVRIVGIVNDITYKLKAEQKLLESEERYRLIYNNISISILEYDKNGIITGCNDMFLSISGVKTSKIIGFDISHKLYNGELWEAMMKPLSGQFGYYKGYFTPELGNKEMFIEADFAPITKNNGTITGAIGIIEDISEKFKSESALKRSENDFRQLFENAHDAILIFTPFDERVLNVNDRACELYGFTKEEFIGLSLKTLTKNIEQGRSKIREVLENGKMQNMESMQYKKDGTLMYLEINASLIEYEGKQAVLSIHRDVTDRRMLIYDAQKLLEEQKLANATIENYAKRLERMNNNLLKSEEQLANLVSTKDKFLSIIAHDLKNPIKGFMNLTNILIENAFKMEREDILQHALAMNSSGEQLYKLLDDLLSWSRLQSGIIDFKPRIQYVTDLVKKSLTVMGGVAKEKGINIVHEEYFPYSVFIDVNMVDTIIRNLISNAIKFTKPGGEVRIYAKEKDENYIELTIQDNGIGIPQSLQQNIFRIDKNLTNPGTSNEVGSGLGLILCKELIQKNGGEIYYTSQSGKGSKFMITLPKANRL